MKAATLCHASRSSTLLHSSEASAESSNISVMADTFETSHAEMPGWLKASARLNVNSMFVTWLVSQASSELKAVVELNVSCIVVTLLVSQTSGCVKATMYWNVHPIFVTLLVSQPPICALKVVFALRRNDMSSTRDTSTAIGPCVASAVGRSSTAAFSVALSVKTPPCAGVDGGGGDGGGGEGGGGEGEGTQDVPNDSG